MTTNKSYTIHRINSSSKEFDLSLSSPSPKEKEKHRMPNLSSLRKKLKASADITKQ